MRNTVFFRARIVLFFLTLITLFEVKNSRNPLMAYENPSATIASRWDHIVTGKWYVPRSNMTAYTVGLDSLFHVPIGFLNHYTFTCKNGSYSGPTQSTIWVEGHFGWTKQEASAQMSGKITPNGQISMTITPDNPIDPISYAVGNMLFISGQWRMVMQTTLLNQNGTSTYDLQWGSMTKLPAGQPFPIFDPSQIGKPNHPGDPLTSPQYSFLKNTEWVIHDSEFFNSGEFGTFRIFRYTDGYFFGTSVGASKFSVTGTVAENGSLYVVLTSPDGSILTRAGTLARSKNKKWYMLFESYYGATEFGEARMIGK